MRNQFKHRRKKTENLLPHQHQTLKTLQWSDKLLVVQCNKNLGPLIERDQYIFLVQQDHLDNLQTYKRLDEEEAMEFANTTIKQVNRWTQKYSEKTTPMERQFIQKSVTKNKNPLPKFYATMKVHKMPLKHGQLSWSVALCWRILECGSITSCRHSYQCLTATLKVASS